MSNILNRYILDIISLSIRIKVTFLMAFPPFNTEKKGENSLESESFEKNDSLNFKPNITDLFFRVNFEKHWSYFQVFVAIFTIIRFSKI